MNFFTVSFVVDIERCSDAWLLFAYLNEADCICIMKSLKSLFIKKKYIYSYKYILVITNLK